jgi:amino acid transporter
MAREGLNVSHSPQSATPAAGRTFRREAGVLALMLTSLGSIIGSGWLLGALKASKEAGGASSVSWVLAGAVIILLALVHAELSATYPLAGGTARYPKLALGSFAGFTAGWTSWLQAVTIAPIEVEAVFSYLNHLVPGLVDDSGALKPLGLTLAILLMAVFTYVNALGVRWLAGTNNVTTIWKIAVPIITVVVLIALTFHPHNFVAGGGFAPNGAHGIFAALPAGVVFSLQGFEQAGQLGAEARDPQRTLPRAIISAVLIGTLIYLALELAFIGALNPDSIAHGWSNPISKGDFGPYASLATSAGAIWLAVILYIDAFISPAGTGLVYFASASRLSYALSADQFLPRVFSKISKRGIPLGSVLLCFVVGVICFLPFPSWQDLVNFITSATVIMYGFAPISLLALRKSDPDRPRTYRLPAASVLAPLSFIAANEIIYWAGWTTNWKVLIAIVLGYVLMAASFVYKRGAQRPPLDLRTLIWIAPWFAGTALISYLGQYDGQKIIPEWIDLLVIAAFSLVIFYVALQTALAGDRVAREVEAELTEAEAIAPEATPA